MSDETDSPPDIGDMIAGSVGDRGGDDTSALDSLQIRITDDTTDDDGEPEPTVRVYTGEVRDGTQPRARRGRPAGKSVVRKKAEIAAENEQLRKQVEEMTAKDAPQRRQNVATMISLLSIMVYGTLAELRDMPHYALKEEESKEIGDAFAESMPAEHIAAIDEKLPYAMPVTALLAPLVRGVVQEFKLRRAAQRRE